MKSDMIETFLNKRLFTSPRTRKNYRTSIQGYFKLLEKTLDTVKAKRSGLRRPRTRPERLIADRGYDSNEVRKALKKRHIEPIIPARCNNKAATDQDGRKLRRYRRRWIVERSIGWLGNFRRLTVRWDRDIGSYAGFFHLACALIVLRRVLK